MEHYAIPSRMFLTYELCPEKPILPSRQRFGETFIDDIKKNSNHIIFLEGLPGCGKTNFISYLSQMNESIVDLDFTHISQ